MNFRFYLRFHVLYLILILVLACNNKKYNSSENADIISDTFFNSNGTRINYWSKGNGKPVILIHGYLVNSKWNWIEPGIFDSLAKKYHVIAMDVRGFGSSEKPHSQEAYGKVILEDINQLMNHLNINKAYFVGYSMGGEIVLSYLTSYPERVMKAVAGGSGWVKKGDSKYELWKDYNDKLGKFTGSILLTEYLFPGANFDTGTTTAINANDAKSVSSAASGMLQLAIEENVLRENKISTLLIIGEKDPFMYCADAAMQTGANMKLLVLAGQDHLSTIKDPSFVTAIKSFLEEE